jgi:hypothetical protein
MNTTHTPETGTRIYDTDGGLAGTVLGHDGGTLLVAYDGVYGLYAVLPENAIVASDAPVWDDQQLTLAGMRPDVQQGALF